MLFSSVCRTARSNQKVVSFLDEIRTELNNKAGQSNNLDNIIPEDLHGMSSYIDNKNYDPNKFQLISGMFFKFSFFTVIPNKNINFNDYKNVFDKYLTIYGMAPLNDDQIAGESFDQNDPIVVVQPKNNYFWIKFFTILGFGGLAYYLYKRSKK